MAKRGPTTARSRSSTARRVVIATGTVAGTALVGVIVTDVYGQLTDDAPDRPLTAVAEAPTFCPGGSFVVPASLIDELPASSALDSRWVREHGGFDDSPMYRLTVQGTGATAVVLHSLRVVDVERGAEPAEPVALTTCFGGGDLYPRRFEVDLDAQQPTVNAIAGDLDIPDDGGDPAVTFPYSVASGDPEVFWVSVANTDCYCSFALELSWTSGGDRGTTLIELDGGAFAVAPVNPEVAARTWDRARGGAERSRATRLGVAWVHPLQRLRRAWHGKQHRVRVQGHQPPGTREQ